MKRALGLCLLAAAFGCRAREAALPANAPTRPALSQPAAAGSTARRFPVRGVITAVNAPAAQITVAHDEISGFGAASTERFAVVDDPRVVALLRPGDRIEATLVVDGGRTFLEQVLTKGFVPTPSPASPRGAAGAIRPEPNKGIGIGDRVPDFALTDQAGNTVRLAQFRGEPLALTFVYTRCPVATACPMTMTKFSRLNAALAKARFGTLLCVTVDPEHDTPGVLKDYASRAGADPARWRFLTGDPAAVARVAETFGVLYYPERGQIVHSQAVAVVDGNGRLATIVYGEDWEPETLFRDLEKARKG